MIPYKTRALIARNISHIFTKPWPPALDTHRVPPYRKAYAFYEKILPLICAGDIILTRKNWYLSNIFIGGEHTHAAVYLGGSYKQFSRPIIHMVHPACTVEELITLLMCDKVQVWRKRGGLGTTERRDVQDRAIAAYEAQVPYDYDFCKEDAGSKLYCFEGVVHWYQSVRDVEFYADYRLHKKVYTDSFVKCGKGFDLVYAS